jgi:hypothetical protein
MNGQVPVVRQGPKIRSVLSIDDSCEVVNRIDHSSVAKVLRLHVRKRKNAGLQDEHAVSNEPTVPTGICEWA